MLKERKRERDREEKKKVRSTPISFNTHEAYKLQMFQCLRALIKSLLPLNLNLRAKRSKAVFNLSSKLS